MTTFLGKYRGAAIFEIEEFSASEGKKMGAKIIAKAVRPDQNNVQVDFIEKDDTQEVALRKIKKAIDDYLDQNNIEKFETDI